MKIGFFKNRKILILALILLGIFYFNNVHAINVGGVEASAVDLVQNPAIVAQLIISVIFSFFSLLLNAILTIIIAILSGIITLTEFKDVPLVTMGWTLMRDFVNLFFILILLFIGFATILNLEKYGIKKLLPSLLIAALLINFSLVIAGFVLDTSQALTKLLINKMNLTNGSFADQLSAKIGMANFSATVDNASDDAKKAPLEAGIRFIIGQAPGGVLFNWLTSSTISQFEKNNTLLFLMLFKIFILLIFVFALAAATIFFFVRIAAIWLLLIAAPAAWGAYATPWGKKYWSEWWDKFLRWAFFAPLYIFILYLTLKAVEAGNLGEQLANLSPETSMERIGIGFKFLIQFILVIILLLGGLKFALSMADKNAKFMMSTATKFAGAVSGYGFAKGFYGAYKKKREEYKAPGAAEVWGKRLGFKMGVPISEKIKARMLPKAERAKWFKEQEEKRMSEHQKRNQSFSNKELNDKLKLSKMSDIETKAIMKILLERDSVSDEMKPYLKTMTDPKDIKKILSIRPEFFKEFSQQPVETSLGVKLSGNENEQLATVIQKSGLEKISKDSLKDIRVLGVASSISGIGISGIRDALKKYDIYTKEQIQKHYKAIIDQINSKTLAVDKAAEKNLRQVYALGGGNAGEAFIDSASIAEFIKETSTQNLDTLDVSFAENASAFESMIKNLNSQQFSQIIRRNMKLASIFSKKIGDMTKAEFLAQSSNPKLAKYIEKQSDKIGISFKADSTAAPKSTSAKPKKPEPAEGYTPE